MTARRAGVSLLLLTLCTRPAAAQTSTQELKRMSLEDLLKIEVTTVSRVPEQTTSVPAAVFVITQEDIRRSGARSIPEALRLAPGVQVTRINGGTWSIGIRGFADRLARSMLVLIDGRAVYSPLFAGTYWEAQDVLLQDVDRIEVIRGPGGTLWGANAVNGIVNIITKPANQTQGVYVNAGGGSEERGFGSARYGGTSGSLSYRLYARTLDRGPEFHANGDTFDGWRVAQGGGRADWTLARDRTFTLQGDVYDGRLGERPTLPLSTSPFTQSMTVDAPIAGGNVLARVSGQAGAHGTFSLQTYYDRTSRDELPVGEVRDTGDVDLQHTWPAWRGHTITWGAGYRVTSGAITAVAPSAFTPERRTDQLASAFAQDELVLRPNRWRVTFGAKFEHNDYSGFEFQPSVRLLWTPDQTHTIWAAVSQAVRTPSRVETDYTTMSFAGNSPDPTFVRLLPDVAFAPERLTAYELGYRIRPAPWAYATVSAFYNDLNDLLSTDLLPSFTEASPLPAHKILPVTFANGLHGNSQGVEATGDIRPRPWWRLTANYSYVYVAATRDPGSTDVSQERAYEDRPARHQVQAGSSVDVSSWSFDWLFRHVSEVRAGNIPSYNASTLRAAWHPVPRLELSIVSQDLFEAHHLEWPSGSGGNVEIRRSVYGQITWGH